MNKKERKLLDKYYSRYGISYADYEAKLKEQLNRCDLCGKHKSRFTRRMHLDHNHKTGKVRGILCFFCNRRRVGQLNLEWAKRIYEYLLKWDGENW